MNTPTNTTITSQKTTLGRRTENRGALPSGALWGIVTLIIVAIIFGVIFAAKNNGNNGGNTTPTATTTIDLAVNEADWIKGNPAAKVTIVEFSDFQCPACAAFSEVLKAGVYPKYLNDIRLVYRHFPLPQHTHAIPAARAAEAAGAQGKFWEMHDLLFTNQNKWSALTSSKDVTKTFLGYADSLQLDLEKFSSDMNASATKRAIDADLSQGNAFDVQATPTFYLNGVKMQGFNSFQEFIGLIEKAIKESSSSATSTGTTSTGAGTAPTAPATTTTTATQN